MARELNPIAFSPSQPPSPLLKFAKDTVAGTCGGIVVTLVGHPFDTVKVRLQTQSSSNPTYSGAIDCVKKTLQWEGLGGLYKGVTSPLAGQMFFRASMFSAFGSTKRYLATNADGSSRTLTTADFYKAGAATGFVAAFTEAPIDFYKSQIQVQVIRSQSDPNYKPAFIKVGECVKQTIRLNGIKAPFQGLFTTMVRNVPANAVYLGSFEVLKNKAAAYKEVSVPELPAGYVLGSAALGGIMYWCAIYPIDVCKSAIMTDDIDPAKRKFPNLRTAFTKLYAEGGVGRFYKGFGPCITRAAPANAAMLYTVDKVTQHLNS